MRGLENLDRMTVAVTARRMSQTFDHIVMGAASADFSDIRDGATHLRTVAAGRPGGVPDANIDAAVIMLAERAADLTRSRAPLSPEA